MALLESDQLLDRCVFSSTLLQVFFIKPSKNFRKNGKSWKDISFYSLWHHDDHLFPLFSIFSRQEEREDDQTYFHEIMITIVMSSSRAKSFSLSPPFHSPFQFTLMGFLLGSVCPCSRSINISEMKWLQDFPFGPWLKFFCVFLLEF